MFLRLFVRTAGLSDAKGKPRLTLTVDEAASPCIQSLDENGKIVDRMPQGSK